MVSAVVKTRSLPSSSLERDFRRRRQAAQKRPGNDSSAQRPEIGDQDASPERELIVRKTPAPKAGACQEAAPTEAKSGSKIAAVLEKAKTGITMDEVRAMTGWAKTGGFFGACKRRGLTLTKRKDGNVTVYIAA